MQHDDKLPQSVVHRVDHLWTVISTSSKAVVLVRQSNTSLTCKRAKATYWTVA
jgi:hypothetical protein